MLKAYLEYKAKYKCIYGQHEYRINKRPHQAKKRPAITAVYLTLRHLKDKVAVIAEAKMNHRQVRVCTTKEWQR